MQETPHKAGYVNIIGKPNVGKSTLMNAFMGEKFSIITRKAQTTRHRILGIWNEPEYQIVFSDTPGIIDPKYGLQKKMMSFVHIALEDADILLYMREANMPLDSDSEIQDLIQKSKVPLFVILNKIDLAESDTVQEQIKYWQEQSFVTQVFPISASESIGIEPLRQAIIASLPVSPPYFPKDQITDRPEKFFVEEIIREKILLNYKQEIPYSVEVYTESFKEEPEIIKIRAVIFTERQSQKPILIGKNGEKLKKVGTEARLDLEQFFAKKIYLETFVRVKENWRNDDRQLRQFGYEQ